MKYMESFVRQLEKHAKRILVVVYQAPPQSQIYPLWEPVHGVPRLPLPSLPEFLEVLSQLGVDPKVEVVPIERARGFESIGVAKDQIAQRLYVTPETPEMERLDELLSQVIEEKNGIFAIKGADKLEPRVVSWQPKS